MTPRTRLILQTIRIVGALAGVGIVVTIWTLRPNPYAWWLFLASMLIGFPAAIASLVIRANPPR